MLEKAGFLDDSIPRDKKAPTTKPASIVSQIDEVVVSRETAALGEFSQDGADGQQQGRETTFTPYTAEEMLQDLEQNALLAEKKYQNLQISVYISIAMENISVSKEILFFVIANSVLY